MKIPALISTIFIYGIISAEDDVKYKFADGLDGFTWGTSLDDIRKKISNPLGGIRLSNNTILLIATTDKAYQFTDKKLSGVMYGQMLDYTITAKINGGRYIENRTSISDGIVLGDSFDDVNKSLNGQLGSTGNYQVQQIINGCQIDLRFSSMESNGIKQYTLHAVNIEKLILDDPKIDVTKELSLF